ncbi:MAG TPA: MgtC/SapB family protein [Hydrogenothermaceae bacterium]|nr:MgtC/SapB family protein [Hydrogenothermaceae bacterium]
MNFKEIGIDEKTLEILIKILISTSLGLIIGLERERKAKTEAFIGIRTTPLIAILGTLSSFIYENYWNGIFIFSFGALILFSLINYFKDIEKDIGITTEIASIIAFIIGVLVYYNHIYISIFIALLITTLLALKPILEKFAKSLSLEDIISILKFLLVVIVIYPLLPDKNFGPFDAFNLKSIWKVVIIVSTLDFIGYVLIKWKGAKTLWITGVVGGLISSTAVSYQLARKTKEYPKLLYQSSIGISLAWTIMNIRVIVLAGLISLEIAKAIFLPLVLASIIFLIIIFIKYREKFAHYSSDSGINISNPFELWAALQFGIIYAFIKFSIEFLDHIFGSKGIYLASFISGVIDVDAITLSLAILAKDNPSSIEIVTKGILIAVISNSFFKFIYVFLFGTKELTQNIAYFLAIISLVCGLYIII